MKVEKLVEGKAYFCCGYQHEDYPFPVVEAYVYQGKDDDGFKFSSALDVAGSALVDKLPNIARGKLQSFFKSQGLLIKSEDDLKEFVTDLDGLIEFVSNLRTHPKADLLG